MLKCLHLFWCIIITGFGTLSFMKSGLWGSGKSIHANAALTKSVKNLCKRLNLIPACTNAHKRCHPLFYVFVHVAQTHRDESNISSVPVCDVQALLLPVQLSALQECGATQLKQLRASRGFPNLTYMSSSKRIMWNVKCKHPVLPVPLSNEGKQSKPSVW